METTSVTNSARKSSLAKHGLRITAALWLTLVMACSNNPSGSQGNLRRISLDEAHDMVKNPVEGLVILDVRTADEIAQGRIASEITTADALGPNFRSELDALDKTVPYLLYCRSGNRSSQALKVMEELGFENVAEIEGGILGWVANGYQTY